MLGEPIRIGTRTVRNRIVFPAHLTNAAEENRPSAQHAAYYAARAAGGAGLVIVEEQAIDRPYEKAVHGLDPADNKPNLVSVERGHEPSRPARPRLSRLSLSDLHALISDEVMKC